MDLRRALLHQLESLQRSGVVQLRRVVVEAAPAVPVAPAAPAVASVVTSDIPPSSVSPAASTALPLTPTPSPMAKSTPRPSAPRSPAPRPASAAIPLLAAAAANAAAAAPKTVEERRVALDVLNQEVKACQRCKVLAKGRTQTVFGVGNVKPRLCLFGEAPGADEDAQGEPFVGRAGQLLNKIISAMTLRREDVYILNVLKCRPPDNRTPTEEEAENCRPFFEKQLEILQPEFICCLGSTAAKTLLRTGLAIGKLRGRFFDYRGAKVIATYHPSYLLRNPAAKKDVWIDMQELMKAMGIPIP